MLACRATSDPAQRLACFDKAVGALSVAADSQEIAVVDRQQVRQARHSLFGFAMPSLKVFGFGGTSKEDAEDEKELDTTLRAARQDGDGRWIVVLQDGAVWHQIDANELVRAPHPGSTVKITQGAFGSYVMHVDGALGFKARRES